MLRKQKKAINITYAEKNLNSILNLGAKGRENRKSAAKISSI